MKHTKQTAALIREATRRAGIAYCLLWKVDGMRHCFNCPLCKNDNDCHGNLIGTYEIHVRREIAKIMELPSVKGHERKNEP